MVPSFWYSALVTWCWLADGMGEVTWIHNHIIFQFLYLTRVNGRSRQAYSSLGHSCLDLPIYWPHKTPLTLLPLLTTLLCWPRGGLYTYPTWVVPGVAYLFVSNAELHICHLPLTCHYKTGSGFQFLAKLFDTSACLPQKYSNSILCFFVDLQVCANCLCFLAPNRTKTEVFASRYVFMFPHPPILVRFLKISLIFFTYAYLFLSYHWTTF